MFDFELSIEPTDAPTAASPQPVAETAAPRADRRLRAVVDGSALREAFARSLHAVSREPRGYNVDTAGRIEVAEDRIVCVATDGHRLIEVVCPARGAAEKFSRIIDRRTWERLALHHGTDPMTISTDYADEGPVLFQSSQLSVDVQERHTFPENYARMFDVSEHTCRVTVDRAAFLAAADASAARVDEEGPRAVLKASGDSLALFTPGSEDFYQSIPAEIHGKDVTAINPAYLADALTAATGERVIFHLRTRSHSIVFESVDPGRMKSVRGIVMPVRIGNEDLNALRSAESQVKDASHV